MSETFSLTNPLLLLTVSTVPSCNCSLNTFYLLWRLIECNHTLFTPDTSDFPKKHLALRQQQIKQGGRKVCQTHLMNFYLPPCFNVSCRSICLMVRNKTPDCPFHKSFSSCKCFWLSLRKKNLSTPKINTQKKHAWRHHSFFFFCCSIVRRG